MLTVVIPDIEVRGHEIKEGRKSGKPYIIVHFEDSMGRPQEIIDRDMENEEYYKRGTQGQFIANLDIGRNFTTFEIKKFEIRKNE